MNEPVNPRRVACLAFFGTVLVVALALVLL